MEAQEKFIEDLKILNLSMQALSKLKEIRDHLKNTKKKRSCSVRLVNRDRNKNGFFKVTFLKIKEDDFEEFFNYTRMSPEQFDSLLTILKPRMVKTSLRAPISPECRLAVILMFLAQGIPVPSLALSFKLGKETVRSIILETAEIMWKTLMPIYLSEPTTKEYQQLRSDFWNIWKMPNCVGAIDGRHIAIRCPSSMDNSQFVDNKKIKNIVLLAVCDAKYQFTYVDVGPYGSQKEGGIFQVSNFGKRLLGNTLPILSPTTLQDYRTRTTNYFVGDASFPLAPHLMRPYPGSDVILPPEKKNFNKRLSKARSTIDNSLGILFSRWRILLTTLHMIPENAEKIVLACFCLHNFLMLNSNNESISYCPENYVDWEDSNGLHHDGLWRSEIQFTIPSLVPSPNAHQYGGAASTTTRNIICEYLKKH